MEIEVLKNQEWYKIEPENIKKDDVFRYGGQDYIYKADEDAYVNRMGTVNFGFSVVSEEEVEKW
ncbi:hypothetical protein [Paenibacillus donghaensis]|nr:hypothetical protein [Paenibacillus donghaensis]